MDLLTLPMEELFVRNVLTAQVQVSADRPFIRCGTDVATYGDVPTGHRAYAAALAELDVDARRARRASCCPTRSSTSRFSSAWPTGGHGGPDQHHVPGFLLEYVLNDSGCAVLIADPVYLPALWESREELAHLRTIAVTGEPELSPSGPIASARCGSSACPVSLGSRRRAPPGHGPHTGICTAWCTRRARRALRKGS